MTRTDIVSGFAGAIKSNTFLTPKHDPTGLGVSWDSYRTVLSYDLAGNLEGFILSENYDLNLYENTEYPKSPIFVEIVPKDTTFSIPGSGVQQFDLYPSLACDRLVAVSGSKQGWHIIAEESAKIQARAAAGKLLFSGKL